jgi:hypothetical protein
MLVESLLYSKVGCFQERLIQVFLLVNTEMNDNPSIFYSAQNIACFLGKIIGNGDCMLRNKTGN